MIKKILALILLLGIKQINGQIISTVAGSGSPNFSGLGGQATSANIGGVSGVVFDVNGNMYIADGQYSSILKVNTSGIITIIAGIGTGGYSGDGGQATNAKLLNPQGITLDGNNNIYIADATNNRIRKINTLGIITTIAGTGATGYTGDGGQATNAVLSNPVGVTFDINGSIYVSDNGNNCVRKISTSGIITTIVGNGTAGFSGDGGQAINAELYAPEGLAFDETGNLYISDNGNSRIRLVNTLGVITTIVGNGTYNCSGDGGQATNAEIAAPYDIIIDASGNLYVDDEVCNRIRMVSTTGIITTIVGNGYGSGTGTGGYSGDGGQATAAELYRPIGITFDNYGNLYIADTDNNRVRKVSNVANAGIEQIKNVDEEMKIYPNPTNNSAIIEFTDIPKTNNPMRVAIYNSLGQIVSSEMINLSQRNLNLNLSERSPGLYNIVITQGNKTWSNKVVKQ